MAEPDAPRRGTIRPVDILLLLLLPAAMLAFLLVNQADLSVIGILCGGVLTVAMIGGGFGMRSANRSGFEGGRRAISVFGHILGVIVPIGVITFLTLPYCSGSPMGRNESAATAFCKAFAEAE